MAGRNLLFIPQFGLNQLTDNSVVDNTSSPEEDAEFRRIEAFNKTAKVRDDFKASMIKRMAAVARQSHTISAEAMCTELFNAGCRFVDDKRQI
ncbi:hypothetical protein [Shewanella glacialipiscicola]|uniref:hypothetical protein n=1 Tax=Shewanella glacialipiscicola TaxID=614069 RepID=UPI003D799042